MSMYHRGISGEESRVTHISISHSYTPWSCCFPVAMPQWRAAHDDRLLLALLSVLPLLSAAPPTIDPALPALFFRKASCVGAASIVYKAIFR